MLCMVPDRNKLHKLNSNSCKRKKNTSFHNVCIQHSDANQLALCVLQGSSKKFGSVLSSQDGQQTAAVPFPSIVYPAFHLFWFVTHCNAVLKSTL